VQHSNFHRLSSQEWVQFGKHAILLESPLYITNANAKWLKSWWTWRGWWFSLFQQGWKWEEHPSRTRQFLDPAIEQKAAIITKCSNQVIQSTNQIVMTGAASILAAIREQMISARKEHLSLHKEQSINSQ
jgi:hypothetical protein